jgi:UDP-glucuronate 4-epimerase
MNATPSILVTGAAGFLGSTLVDRLLRDGRRVVGLDSFDPFYPEAEKRANVKQALAAPEFRLERGDVCDPDALERCFAGEAVEAVVHLAALAGVRPSIERPARYADVNVHGTARVLEAAVRHGVGQFVFASSSSVYGERKQGPFRESDPVERPISPYAATKRAGELLAHTFHHVHGLSITCARIFTGYGPRQRPDLAIRKFAERMLRGDSIPVYGDGASLRDFTYVDDLVEGLVLAVERRLGFAILNLGAGQPVALARVIDLLERTIGTKARIEWLPRQAGDVSRTWADVSAAHEALGYQPRVTLEAGVPRLVEWLRARSA